MNRSLFATGFALLLLGVALVQPRAQLTLTGVGGAGSGIAAFQGPGDVVGSALTFWGAQAYTAAYASGGGLAFNVCLVADASCGDLVFNSSGTVVDGLIGASHCSVVTCTIKTAYDQTGNSNDATNPTEATRPTILFNCQNGHACMVFASGSFLTKVAWNGGVSVSQPWTVSVSYKDTATGASGGALVATKTGGTNAGLYFYNTPENSAFCGSDLLKASTSGAWHAATAVGNTSPNAAINVDGSNTTGNCGALALAQNAIFIGNDGNGSNYVGQISGAGVWGTNFSSTQSSNVSANYHTFGGF